MTSQTWRQLWATPPLQPVRHEDEDHRVLYVHDSAHIHIVIVSAYYLSSLLSHYVVQMLISSVVLDSTLDHLSSTCNLVRTFRNVCLLLIAR
jgi:hypothetical protein